jgi:hypothetical protein
MSHTMGNTVDADDKEAVERGYEIVSSSLYMKQHDTAGRAYDLYVHAHEGGYDASYKMQTADRSAWYNNGNETMVAEDCPSFALADEMIGSFVEDTTGE